MWEWDRKVVLPLAFAAFERAMGRQREDHTPDGQPRRPAWEAGLDAGRQLLDHYLAWAPAADRFWPVRVETDFDIQIPDPSPEDTDRRHPPAASVVRYGGRVDLLLVDEHDAYWVVRHRLVRPVHRPRAAAPRRRGRRRLLGLGVLLPGDADLRHDPQRALPGR